MSSILVDVLAGTVTMDATNVVDIIESAFSTLDDTLAKALDIVKATDTLIVVSDKTAARLVGKTPYVSGTTAGTRRVTTLPPADVDDKTLADWWKNEIAAKRATSHDAAKKDPIRKTSEGWALADILPGRVAAVKAWAKEWAPGTADIEAELDLAKAMLAKAKAAKKSKALQDALEAEIAEIQDRLDAALDA
jgi:hypothetical protein